jgi:hypothetical protein
MANLEFANLFLPANSAPGAAIAAGAAVATDDPAMAQTPSFSQLLQAGVTREPATGAVIAGLAGMSALLNGVGLPAANQPRALRPDLTAVAPADLGALSLNLPTAAALLAEALMPGAETGETGDSKDSSVSTDTDSADPANANAPTVVQWSGLSLFIEARAALRNDSPAGNQPEPAASVAGIESARWSFMLRSAGPGQLAGGDRAPASLAPATPEIFATDTAELAAAITEIELPPTQIKAESPKPAPFNAPSPTNPVAPLITGRTEQTAPIAPTPPPEPTTPAALNLRNPVAPLITGRTEQIAPIAPTPPPEPTAPAALNLRNPVAPLITGRTEQTAPTAPTPPPEPTTPAALNLRNPVTPLITGRTEQTAPTPPPEPTALAALNLRNPVAPLATLAKPDRIEPGPLNPVAPLTGTDKTSPLTAANVKTTPVVRHTDQTIENNAITRNENAAAVRDRVAASLPGLQSALAPLLRPQMHIAAPFTRYTAESEPLAEDRAGPAEPAAWLDDAPPPNAVKPERPATLFTPVSASLPDIGQAHRSPAELAVTPMTSHHEPAILDATTTPLTVEPATVPPAGSPPQAGLSSAVAPARPDAATPSTALPTTPDTVDLNQKNWGRTLGHQLNWMVNNQLQQAEIRVNPPDLGPIELRVSLQNNQTSVTFFCHESAVREALENALPRLREMLDSQGISLNQAQVSDQSLARQQAGGGGGQPSFGQRDDRPPAHPPIREPVATETAPRPRARRLPGTVDDYA